MSQKLAPPRLVAVDTNVALDFSAGVEDVCDAIATIRTRISSVELWLPPTTVQELAHLATVARSLELRQSARRMLRQHRALGFRLVTFIPLGFDQVERISQCLRSSNLLPRDEVNDSLILAEAAALGCTLLTSSDAHLRSVDHAKLKHELGRFDLAAPIIATPREIVRMFFW